MDFFFLRYFFFFLCGFFSRLDLALPWSFHFIRVLCTRFQFSVNFYKFLCRFSFFIVNRARTLAHIIQTACGHWDINAPLLQFNVSENAWNKRAQTRKKWNHKIISNFGLFRFLNEQHFKLWFFVDGYINRAHGITSMYSCFFSPFLNSIRSARQYNEVSGAHQQTCRL